MKKFYVAAAAFFAMGVSVNAQILLSEDFQGDLSHIQVTYPSVTTSDTSWYDHDNDGFADGSGGSRAGEWFLAYAMATADSLTPTMDTNVVMASNSWHSSPSAADNWLITRSIMLPAGTGVLTFKSATRQTPYYLDGYEVLISTTDNDLGSFNAGSPLITAAEYTGGSSTLGGDFASYTFAPAGAWIQGWNGTAMVPSELEYDGDSARFVGILTTKTVNLGAYAGQNIFIAFHHNSFDDNLTSIDDIQISWTVGVNENESLLSKVNVYPNPTTDYLTLEYTMSAASPVIMTITDISGRVVATESLGLVAAGVNKKELDVTGYAEGTYNVQLRTDRGNKSFSFVKK